MAIGAKTVILFYAIELMIARCVGREVMLRGVVVVVLALLTIKSDFAPFVV